MQSQLQEDQSYIFEKILEGQKQTDLLKSQFHEVLKGLEEMNKYSINTDDKTYEKKISDFDKRRSYDWINKKQFNELNDNELLSISKKGQMSNIEQLNKRIQKLEKQNKALNQINKNFEEDMQKLNEENEEIYQENEELRAELQNVKIRLMSEIQRNQRKQEQMNNQNKHIINEKNLFRFC